MFPVSTGAFLMRAQPLHKAHLNIIKRALAENDHVVVVLGSFNKWGTERNPFQGIARKRLLEEALADEFDKYDLMRIKIVEMPDWSMETDDAQKKEWGRYLYYNIVRAAGSRNFRMYYSDTPEIMESWFEPELMARIEFRFMERSGILNGLSATKIREAILKGDKEYVRQYCPPVMVREFDDLQYVLQKVYENPREDYSMEGK